MVVGPGCGVVEIIAHCPVVVTSKPSLHVHMYIVPLFLHSEFSVHSVDMYDVLSVVVVEDVVDILVVVFMHG